MSCATDTRNKKQLGFCGLREFVSRASFFVGGQELAPKTQPFHIVKRWHQLNEITDYVWDPPRGFCTWAESDH